MRRPFLISAAVGAFALVAALILFTDRTEITRISSPDGRFHAVTTVASWRQLVPLMPGQSSDQRCSVEVIREDGTSMGEIPVDMVQNATVEWTPGGAQIKLVGGWDFVKGLCWRWNLDHTGYTYIQGRAP
jgi:hypothetical protein